MSKKTHICEAKDCKEKADVRCHIVDYETEPAKDFYYWYCHKHAKEYGYCYLCGEFFAGIEEFDFPKIYGHIPGLCPVCSDMVKADAGEFDDEEQNYYDYEYFTDA